MAHSRPLDTPRLTLEPFAERHLSDRYVGWLNDPEVVRFSEQRHRTHSRESAAAYLRSFEGTPHYFWAVLTRDAQPVHIGNINAYVDPVNGVADIGVLIGDKTVWGCGYGGEAWIAICRFLLDSGLRKVTGGTLASNLGMMAIMRRAGMSPDGVRRRHAVVDGEPVDMVHMALFRDGPVTP